MSGSQDLLLGSFSAAAAGYQIQRSLRFNSADSAYLNRTPASASNRKTWTWSGWVKLTAATNAPIFGHAVDSNNFELFQILADGTIRYIVTISGTNSGQRNTTRLLRDYGAWYHLVLAKDAANTAVNIYVNGGSAESSFATSVAMVNTDGFINNTVEHRIGLVSGTSLTTAYANQYLTEVNFIDGQALTPSSFGQTNAQTGVWEPAAYTGTYGTNGFYLNFSDNSGTTSTTLGKDSSGNANNWTPNNFSVTAGAGNDSLVDTPTPYGTDTGAGGEVRGNYCTLNPFLKYSSLGVPTNGNLDITGNNANWRSILGTIGSTSGKWYAEFTVQAAGADMQVGVLDLNNSAEIYQICNTDNRNLTRTSSGYAYQNNAKKVTNNTETSYGATWTTGDVIGVALDLDGGTITFYKNGSSQGQAFSSLSGNFAFGVSTSTSTVFNANFGQRPFAYTAPSGYKALCTQNLPTPTIGATSTTQAGKYFNAVLYTGTGTSQSITGVGFQPDLVWTKARGSAKDHNLTDAVRGTSKALFSNTTSAEVTGSWVTAFNSDGFTVGTEADANQNTIAFVGWNWKANGAGSSNTSGSITSTVSANTTAGFSIVTITTTGANSTVGHGLGVAPSMIILKRRDSTGGWAVYHSAIGNTKALVLNLTDAAATEPTYWNNTSPTSTVFSLGSIWPNNATYVAYCFAPVAGYSAFGSYTGNGSSDGPFVYTGFRPAMIWTKQTNTTGPWNVLDNKRGPYNVNQPYLQQNSTNTEATVDYVDFLSNGFKIRYNSNSPNANGDTILYIAFAEVPTKFALAR